MNSLIISELLAGGGGTAEPKIDDEDIDFYHVQSTLTIRIWLGPGQIILITSYSYGEHP